MGGIILSAGWDHFGLVKISTTHLAEVRQFGNVLVACKVTIKGSDENHITLGIFPLSLSEWTDVPK